MLEQIMDFIHNYFVLKKYRGQFVIESGNLVCDFLQDGQYFKIVHSVFNDGVHQWFASAPTDPTEEREQLHDENFSGEVWAMAVPPTLIALAAEIEEWLSKYGDAASSPFNSESFGGYSYTKATGADTSGNGSNPGTGWQSVFASRLNHWRKIA